MSSPGTAQVSVTTPTPGGDTSSAAQFTINAVVSASQLVIMATPVYSGSSSGPWQLSVAAADSNGNPIPNLALTLQASEGTITQIGGSSDSTGVLSATISPPSTYSGEAVAVTATSGGQTAVVHI